MPHRRTTLRARVPTAVGALAALTLASCAPSSADDDEPEVLTAFYPLEYVAHEVAGGYAGVGSLAPTGGDAHNLELSPHVVARLTAADLVVYLSGFQRAVDDAVEQAAPRRVLDVAGAARLLTDDEHAGDDPAAALEAPEQEHDESHAPGDDTEPTAQRPPAAEDEAGHDHGTTDPHFWLDPLRLAEVSHSVADALADADPVNAGAYRANGDRLADELRGLDDEIRRGLERCERDTIVVTHEAYGYLADAYGLEVVSIAGLDPESEPSPARMVEVADTARQTGVSTVFLSSPQDRVAQALADDLGLATAVLDPLETQQDPDADYPAVMRANLAALQEALQCR